MYTVLAVVFTVALRLTPSEIADPSSVERTLDLSAPLHIRNDGSIPLDRFLGQIVTVRSTEGLCRASGVVSFAMGAVTGFNTARVAPPTVPVSEVVVDARVSRQVPFLTYLVRDLHDNEVYLLVNTIEGATRITIDGTYFGAVERFRTKWGNLFTDSSICWMFVIEAARSRFVLRKKFAVIDANSQVGAFAILIAGTYYSSELNYTLERWIDIDVGVLKRPALPTAVGIDAGVAAPFAAGPIDRALTGEEIRSLGAFQAGGGD